MAIYDSSKGLVLTARRTGPEYTLYLSYVGTGHTVHEIVLTADDADRLMRELDAAGCRNLFDRAEAAGYAEGYSDGHDFATERD